MSGTPECDIFISYRRKGGFETAKHLFDLMVRDGYRLSFDIDSLRSGDFDTELLRRIDQCTDFIVILSEGVFDRSVDPDFDREKDWLRIELAEALKAGKNIIPVMLGGFTDFPSDLPEDIAAVTRKNGPKYDNYYFDAFYEKLLQFLHSKPVNAKTDMPEDGTVTEDAVERHNNPYYCENDKKERDRLLVQQKLLHLFDASFYDGLASDVGKLKILDLGSANGSYIMDRLGRKDNLDSILGLEFDTTAVETANSLYGNDNIHFEQCDLEAEDAEEKIRALCVKHNIEDFNVIHMSMLLLHLKNPRKLLKLLRKIARPGTIVVVKDIDDGLNLAYPDQDGLFSKAMELCSRNPLAGYRKSGREIPFLLKKSGFSNVELARNGFNTLGLDFDEKEALFHIYFSFIKEDYATLHSQYPSNQFYKDAYGWITDNYEKLEESFLNDDFFFSIGFMLYTAKR